MSNLEARHPALARNRDFFCTDLFPEGEKQKLPELLTPYAYKNKSFICSIRNEKEVENYVTYIILKVYKCTFSFPIWPLINCAPGNGISYHVRLADMNFKSAWFMATPVKYALSCVTSCVEDSLNFNSTMHHCQRPLSTSKCRSFAWIIFVVYSFKRDYFI